jgi:hypothetical protein
MAIAYISGHLDITEAEFGEHYLQQIQSAIECGDRFVVGDAKGTDLLAQITLSSPFRCEKKRVTVYHMFSLPRNNITNFQTIGGFETDEARDAAMTYASDYDIAWVRPGRENSGTAKNIKRRQTMLKA